MQELDLLDRRILYELDRNSRAPYSDMGKMVRAKKETVKHRIEKLVQSGIIQGFYTVIDYSKLGFISIRMYVTFEDMVKQKRDEFIEYIVKHPHIWIIFRTRGKQDFAFTIWGRDSWECEAVWNGIVKRFGSYFRECHGSLFTELTEFTREYLAENGGEKKAFAILGKTKKEKLDPYDLEVIQLLSANARLSLVKMAKLIGTSVVTCRSHLKKLIQKKIILGFRTLLDFEKLGYQYYKVDVWFNDMEKGKKVMERVLGHPHTTYTERTLVTSHFEFDLELRNFTEFIKLMDGLEEAFPGAIKRYEYYTLVKNYKINYLPKL